MKLTISQPEIEQAVLGYVYSIINLNENTEVTCDFPGRGNVSAEINILPKKVEAPAIEIKEEPEESLEIVAEEEEPQNNSVRSLFGNLV